MPKVQELRDVADWQRWANVGIQEQLCEKMEALKAVEDPEEIAKQVRELQQQWRQAADVPRAQGEALWRRFKAAHDEAWTRCEAHFAAQNEARAGNLAKKVALSERAEALAESTNWIQTADEIKKLQAEWKTIGPVSRGQEKAIWERFRAACDRFFTRRHADLAERKTMWAENLAKKDALCVEGRGAARFDRLGRDRRRDQAAAGRVEDDRPGEEDALRSDLAALPRRVRRVLRPLRAAPRHRARRTPRRARGDCRGAGGAGGDRSRQSQSPSVASPESSVASPESSVDSPESVSRRVAESAVRRAAESSSQSRVRSRESAIRSRRIRNPQSADPQSEAPPADLMAQVRSLRGRWQAELAARGVERDRAAALDQRFAAAFSGVLDAVAGGLRRHRSRSRREPQADGSARAPDGGSREIARRSGVGSGDAALSPTTRLAAMLKEALAANTIGGKVDDDSRFRAANEEVRQAQAGWSRIGPVPEEARRALADRFQRAIRRITDAAAKVGARGDGWRAGRAGGPDGPAEPEVGQVRSGSSVTFPTTPTSPPALLDLDQLHVEHEHARTARSCPCRRGFPGSRTASSRLRTSAAALRSIPGSRRRAGTWPARRARPSCRTSSRRSSSRCSAP